MLSGMRMMVEVEREDEDPLRRMAIREHRSIREQGGYLLHLKIREELIRRKDEFEEPIAEVA